MSDGYDIIGDIHGKADSLKRLLIELDYEPKGSGRGWRHPDGRRAFFLGDYVDRGTEQIQVLEIVRSMVDEGDAIAIMGNHEFNTICYATPHPDDAHLSDGSQRYLRCHKKKKATETDFAYFWDRSPYTEWIQWMKTLPLWFEHQGFYAIHACWSPSQQKIIAPYLDEENCLSDEGFVATSSRGSAEFKALEVLLKGPEIRLPDTLSFKDKQGKVRKNARLAWWRPAPWTYDRSILDVELIRSNRSFDQEEILRQVISDEYIGDYGQHQLPLFFGHYWLQTERDGLKPRDPKTACLDYSVTKSRGHLVAYRWTGEERLSASNFRKVATSP